MESFEGFGITELERRRRKEVKTRALVACEEKHAILRRCYRNSWIGVCTKEHTDFWECFKKVCICACVAW